MRYLPITSKDREEMLALLDLGSADQLFSQIPSELRHSHTLELPSKRSERELEHYFLTRSAKNTPAAQGHWKSYLGAGAYEHHIPKVVDALSLRGEFATAYTPYQPEVSQGTLQVIFEFQSMIANLTGMEISNASMYDGASATAEAVMMALRLNKSSQVYVSEGVHPEYLKVIQCYLGDLPVTIRTLPLNEQGKTTYSNEHSGKGVYVVQSPNFFGVIEDYQEASEHAHQNQSLLVATVNEVISLGALKSPGECGADIVCGEGQSFGNALSFGGPYVGFLTCKKDSLRQMPGRLVGQTTDKAGTRSYALTLSTREQHIRREKATSNICTNHSLCALRAAIHMAILGKKGIQELALLNHSRAVWLSRELTQIPGVSLTYSSPFFHEFVLKLPISAVSFLQKMEQREILAGLPLAKWFSQRSDEILVTVTETKALSDLEKYVAVARECL